MSSLEIVSGVIPEVEDTLFAEMCLRDNELSFVYILGDDRPLELLVNTLRFFDNTRDIFLFPAWDSHPHRGMSPSSNVMVARIKCLLELVSAKRPYILITSISATIQKVLPRRTVNSLALSIRPRLNLSMDALTKYLVDHGYHRSSSIVQEVGSFATRGEIVDIFQSVDEGPVRIYFEYDFVESIKPFDLDTQITTGDELTNLIIFPASEMIKSSDNLEVFCKKGAYIKNTHPTLYEAIASQQKHIGEEYFLPLLHEDPLETLFDYVRGDAKLVFSESVSSNTVKQIEYIRTEYASQQAATSPEALFLDEQNYDEAMRRFAKVITCGLGSTLTASQCDTDPVISHCTLKPIPDFRLQAQELGTTALTALINYVKTSSKPAIVACYCEESMQYLTEKFKSHDVYMSCVRKYSEISGLHNIAILPIHRNIEARDFVVLTEYSLFGRQCSVKKPKRTINSNESDLTIGDIVVHQDYGIGIFSALRTLTVCGNCHDFVEIMYRNDDKLFVPVEDTDLITRHGTSTDVVLDRLGSAAWQERKTKLKKRIDEIAKTLMSAEAMRRLAQGGQFFANTTYMDFCKECPYVETEDQLKAIADVENDLASGKVMDRLICGDVGFGKTEVALRAAFLIVNEDITCQVAVLVPTTLLCRQHLIAFRERFKNYKNVNIQQLSKATAKKKQQIKHELENGSINIIIGTSALLSDGIQFLDLRLLIIDEEQHFGVQQKEKLRLLKHNIHVLSLSATPIPRTLHMSLSGIKDLSVLKTPPIGRTAVNISITHFDDKIIRTAIYDEVSRGGRVFFTCPLISDISTVLERLKALVPDVKIAVAHGKTSAQVLDKTMNDFYDGKFSLLLTTSIIESGIDIPFANTIIVYNADTFGLAQLYQLKGRVGRSTSQGYAYLILSEKAKMNSPGLKRLETLKSLNSIGSGFSLSLQDMDMRGFGNLVGEEQSGNIKEVGVELYHRMLEEAIETCKMAKDTSGNCLNVKVDINANVRIPESYIRELDLRMQMYKKMSSLKTPEEIQHIVTELEDRFGPPPREVKNLLDVLHIKHLCSRIGISEVTHFKNHITLHMTRNFVKEDALLKHFVFNAGIFTIQGNSVRMVVPGVHARNVTQYIVSRLSHMCSLIGGQT
ncbi:transcription-repair coupling factor [Candidatus Anaplasma sp. TIGMIC]|uniref:transcription-repair coupling factor n=1 Tax=Candidatus Anaplasma sp. TIGMIC TaxID=3020713 RepID=UPI002331504F|nr:transcription-repair coupling factor [Candidatus Anaplasma sp. TIGMIC]MDB1135111.1 transcription-repair coupling factor [Candidatus Anaplasma sp. TIGMIC]